VTQLYIWTIQGQLPGSIKLGLALQIIQPDIYGFIATFIGYLWLGLCHAGAMTHTWEQDIGMLII
jgi:hypothetical protein